MKVLTITCHDVYNQGASLQALALVTYLRSLGLDARIIDYKPDYSNTYYNLGKVANPRFDRPVIKQLYLLAKLPSRLKSIVYRAKPFDRFKEKYLPLTRHYSSLEELKANPPEADVYIAGSDQIWNTRFPTGKDGAFYLEFAPEGSRKLSYAASFATDTIEEKYRDFVSSSLKRFDAISLREATSLPLLRSLGREDGVAVSDPVFLLDKSQWDAFIRPSDGTSPVSGYGNLDKYLKSPYLLAYDAEKTPAIEEIARGVARERGLRIYSVSNLKLSYADKSFWHASPMDFVRLIAGADYVVSNSFHATAFSLIYRKDFCVAARTDHSNSRMLSLLKDFGLESRYAGSFSKELCTKTDYFAVLPVLTAKTETSKQFLKDNIK